MGPLANADTRYLHGNIAYWNEMMEHPNYDAWWQARDTRSHLRNIKPAVMTVGGWFDAEDLFGALNTYKSIEKQSPGAHNILLMSPRFHRGLSPGSRARVGRARF